MTLRYMLPGLLASSMLSTAARFAPADDAGSSIESGAEFSLADLSDLDVSDIEEIRFEVLPQGVFELEVVEAKLEEGTNKDGEKRFWALFDFKVVGVKSIITSGVDKEAQEGKKHGEKLWIDPSKPQDEVLKAIGRIRAFVADMGMDSEGKLGDIVANCKGHTFTGKITHRQDKDDKSIVYPRLKLDAKKK